MQCAVMKILCFSLYKPIVKMGLCDLRSLEATLSNVLLMTLIECTYHIVGNFWSENFYKINGYRVVLVFILFSCDLP